MGCIVVTVGKIIITNKAEVKFLEGNLVIKKYLKPGKAKREFDYLNTLYGLLSEEEYEGWTYKTVKPIKYYDKENQFLMEKACGETFAKLLKDKPALSYQTGIWLALFHNKCRIVNNKLLNIDFNRTNILVNQDEKTLTIIDPGTRFENECSLEEAFIFYISGLITGAIRGRMFPRYLIEKFLEGYFKVSNERCDKLSELNQITESVIYKIYTKKTQKKSIHLKIAYQLYGILVRSYMLTKVKPLIMYYQERVVRYN